LLPLVALSTTAYAGSTITDKSYWPNEARQTAQIRTGSPQAETYSAYDQAAYSAYDQAASRLQAATVTNESGTAWRYQGGPKSR
jgi:hypothetical protein